MPAAILDVRKSLSVAFLAISDQYETLIFFEILIFVNFFTKWLSEINFGSHFCPFQINTVFFGNLFTKGLTVAILDVRKTSLSISFLPISDRYATLIIFDFFYKMAAVGHFGCPKFTLDHISGHFRSIQIFS